MTDAILFPKDIYKKLSSNKDITDIVLNRIYPLVADNNVKMPFIVYKREDVKNTLFSKDGYSEDDLSFSIWIVTTSYATSLDLANHVRKTFEHLKLSSDTYDVRDCLMTDIKEDFEENAYLQVLSFSCKISNK